MKPFFNDQQLQNYAGNFAIASLFSFLTFCWAFFFLKVDPLGSSQENKRKIEKIVPSSSTEKCEESSSFENEPKICNHDVNENEIERIPLLSTSQDTSTSFMKTLKEIVSLTNISGVYTACMKARPGSLRLRIWFMIIALNLSMLPWFGRGTVLFPLVQKLYKWNAVIFSNWATLAGIMNIIAMLVVMPILFKVLKVNDLETAIISCVFELLGNNFFASIVSPWGYYLDCFITSFSAGITSGIRAYLSKILPKDEVTQIFAATIVIEAVLKCIGTVVFAYILKSTIHWYPTLVFHFNVVLLLISLSLMSIADLKTKYPLS